MRALENVERHLGRTAELARQRPFGAFAIGENAAEHPRSRCGAGDFFHLADAVGGEQGDAQLVGARDVALLLDRVAVGDAVGSGAGRQRELDLPHRRGVERGPEIGEQAEDLRRRIGLDGVENARVRHGPGERQVVVADHVEVEDETRAFGTSTGEKVQNSLRCHGFASKRISRTGTRKPWRLWMSASGPRLRTDSRNRTGNGVTPLTALFLPWLGRVSPSALPAKMVCLFSTVRRWTDELETEKARTVVASRHPRSLIETANGSWPFVPDR